MATAMCQKYVVSSSVVALLVVAAAAHAHSSYGGAWSSIYPASTLRSRMGTTLGSSCYACHAPPNTSAVGTCYKDALKARLDAGRTIAQAIQDVDPLDSDGDGVSNHDEILAARADALGGVGYHPGLVGATGTDPCGSNSTAAITGVLETPPSPPVCTGDINNDGQRNTVDLTLLLSNFGNVGPNLVGDLNTDGTVNTQDLVTFLSTFGQAC